MVQHATVLITALLLAAVAFSALGLLLAVPPTNIPSNIMMLSSLLKFPLVFISGIFIPIEDMPLWGKALAIFSPLTYFTDIVRYSLMGTHHFSIVVDLGALLLFTVLFTILAMKMHRRTMPRRM
ncbi:MAG: ABC transporter permease [Methanomicrobiales archaeon]|nr:ABC transporter permease [Methanomicrobiales archaeon]